MGKSGKGGSSYSQKVLREVFEATLKTNMILCRPGKVSEQIQKELDDRLKIAVGITP